MQVDTSIQAWEWDGEEHGEEAALTVCNHPTLDYEAILIFGDTEIAVRIDQLQLALMNAENWVEDDE